MSEDKRQGMARRDTIECESDICVTDAATRNLYDHLIRTGAEGREFTRLQSGTWGHQSKSICSMHACHGGPFRLNSLNLGKLANAAGLSGDDHHNAL